MKRIIFLILIGAIVCGLGCQGTHQMEGEQTEIPLMLANNRDYFPIVHDLIDEAQSSIKVVLFQARYYLAYPGSSTNVALLDLVQAAQRGVDVTVILDVSGWNLESSELNRLTAELLQQNGVKVYYDDPTVTTHDKLVLVDDHLVLIGSTNWNNWAFERNNEANVLINDENLYQVYLEKFNGILANATTDYPFEAPLMTVADPAFEDADYITLSGEVAYTRPGYQDKTFDIVLTDSTEVEVQRDISETLVFLQPDYFQTVAGQSVSMAATVRHFRDGYRIEVIDMFDPGLKQQLFDKALLAEEEAQIDRDMQYEKKWYTAREITPINNRDYFEPVHLALQATTERAWIAMMDSRYYDEKPSFASDQSPRNPPSLTNIFQTDLVELSQQPVDVKFVFDHVRRSVHPDKQTFLEPILEAGGEIYQDDVTYTTHTKMLILDDDQVIVGSTNWTYPAMEENNEAAVIIKSAEVNAAYAAYFQTIIEDCERVNQFE